MAAGLPTSTVYELELTVGSWTDVTADVIASTPKIVVGRDPSSSRSLPGTLDFDLYNVDGRYFPDNAQSTYYPNFTEGIRVRVTVTKGAATSVRFLGHIDTLNPTYPAVPESSTVHVAATDDLGLLARTTLKPVLEHVIPPSAYFYAPLTDLNLASMTMYGSAPRPNVDTNGTPGWRKQAGAGPETQAALTLQGGASLTFTPSGLDPVWGTWSVSSGMASVFVSAPQGSQTNVLSMWYQGEYVLIAIGPNGRLRLTRTDSTGAAWPGSGPTTDVGPVITDGGTHMVTYGEAFNLINSGASLYVDGVAVLNMTAGQKPMITGFVKATLGGGAGGEVTVSHFSTTTFNVLGPFPSKILAAGLVLPSQTLSDQLSDLGTWTGVSMAFDVASTRVGITPSTGGRSALDVLNDIARGESTVAYHDYTLDSVVALSHTTARPITVGLSVDAVLDFEGGPSFERGYAGSLATAVAKSSGGTVSATNATVAGRLGSNSRDVPTTLSSASDLYATATDELATANTSKARIKSFVLNLTSAATDLYATWFALRLGARVRVTSVPTAYFGLSYIDGYVVGWTEEHLIEGWVVTPQLAAADAPPEARFDDATYGRFSAGGTMTLTSSITSSGTSVSITTSASNPTLTVDPTMYPLDLGIGGERMTVSSAPASAVSPQTVTVTRGVAPTVAVAHASGSSVDVWQAASFAF